MPEKTEEMKQFNKKIIIMRKLLLLLILMLCFCSCDDTASDGVVTNVKQYGQYGYTFKVYVNRLEPLAYMDGGQGYWLFTNDTLQIGDTIHIGKIVRNIDYESKD